MAHAPADHHDAQIADPTVYACFGQPLLDMHAMAAQCVDQRGDLASIPIVAQAARVVELNPVAGLHHLDCSRGELLPLARLKRDDTRGARAVRELDKDAWAALPAHRGDQL